MSKLLSVLSGLLCMVGLTCLAFTLGYMYYSYQRATAILEFCTADGLADCHIERDGLEFNVYGENR